MLLWKRSDDAMGGMNIERERERERERGQYEWEAFHFAVPLRIKRFFYLDLYYISP